MTTARLVKAIEEAMDELEIDENQRITTLLEALEEDDEDEEE